MDGPNAVPVNLIAETETLVKRMYDSKFGSEVAQISAQLVSIQQSPAAWQIAASLLSSNDASVRYFGANTFALKLDSERIDFGEDLSEWIQSALISSLISLIANGENTRNLKRMCQALVTYFCKAPDENQNCVKQFFYSLHDARFISSQEVTSFPSAENVVSQLSPERLLCSLWLCSELVVHATKNAQVQDQIKLHDMLTRIFGDAHLILIQCFDGAYPSDSREVLRRDALQGFSIWAKFFIEEHPSYLDSISKIRGLIRPALSCIPDEVLEADQVWVDLLIQIPSILRQEQQDMFVQLFTSQWSQLKLQRIQEGEEDDLQYAELILAYVEATSQDILKNPKSTASQTLFEIMHFFLGGPGTAIEEDGLVVIATETWGNLIEQVSSILFEDDQAESEAWLTNAKRHIMQAIFELQAKMRLPSLEAVRDWDADAKMSFHQFRADVRDMCQSAFAFMNRNLLQNLVERALQSLSRQGWDEVEAALFCLNSITDDISEDSSYDDIMSSILSSPLFTEMASNTTIPLQTKRTTVDLIGNYSEAFKRHTQLLPNALNYLFSSLQNPKLSQQSSKSICLLCSSCRRSLVPELETFMQQYRSFASVPNLDAATKGKVTGGVAAIVQAIPDVSLQTQYLSWLFDIVENDVREMLAFLANFGLENGVRKAHMALESLISMAKALQDPDDIIISLDGGDFNRSAEFWEIGKGHALQSRIAKCIDDISISCREDSEVIEKICTVLRIGYKETQPGPFVLDPTVTVAVVSLCSVDLPRLPLVIATAGACLSKHRLKKDVKFETTAYHLFNHVFSILNEVREPSVNPEVSESCVEFFSLTLHHHSKVLFSLSPSALEYLFQFVVQCIRGQDVLPKRAGCVFWADLMKITKDPTSALHTSAQEIFDHFASTLCDALIGGVCGDAASSTLEYLALPLSQIITSQRQARILLESSLSKQDLRDSEMDLEKRKFLQALMSTRTSIPKRILIDFWSKCRHARLQEGVRMQQENAQSIRARAALE